jgi:hypothetical protein
LTRQTEPTSRFYSSSLWKTPDGGYEYAPSSLICTVQEERCLQRLNGSIRFDEDLCLKLMRQVAQQRVDGHSQRYLLAFVHGYLRDHGLLAVRSVAEKYLLLASSNLVECIAATAPGGTPQRRPSSRKQATPCLRPSWASGLTRQQRRRATSYGWRAQQLPISSKGVAA